MAVSREPQFRTVRMREGYELDAVDDYVDRVIDALEGRSGGRSLTPDQIEAEEFKVVRMREGYVMDDVDDWLDAAAAELRRMRKAGPATHDQAPARAQVSAPPYASPPMPAPPIAAPPMAAPPVSPPAPAYPPYQETLGGRAGYDPFTDSAINELDPALRALEQNHRAVPQPPAQARDQHLDDYTLSGASTPSTGLHHLELWVRDLDVATRSIGWLFERLGWTLFQVWENGRSWQSPGGGPYVVVERSPDLTWVGYDRKAPGLNHLALAVPERWMVDRIVSEAPTYGWRLMFADRHPFAGGAHHYAAYMENDEGFEVEVVAP
ncbi:MAG: DivIVA domain-containing protein [Jiangellaceae bacterium]